MNYIVKDLMVPISEYVTITKGATLKEAVLALENAKVEMSTTSYPHWLVLILDSQQKVIGKLSQLDILRALEPKTAEDIRLEEMRSYGFSSNVIFRMRENFRKNNWSLEKVYSDPATINMKVEEFMMSVADNEFIDENTSLDTAAHQMSLRNRLSLLVTRNGEIVGMLRLADVFNAVINAIK